MEQRRLQACERFRLLKGAHGAFTACIHESLLRLEPHQDDDLLDDWTVLWIDMSRLPSEFESLDIDQIAAADELDRLNEILKPMLDLLEQSILLGVPEAEVQEFTTKTAVREYSILHVFNSISPEGAGTCQKEGLISFPPLDKTIAECRMVIESFLKDIRHLFRHKLCENARRSNAALLMPRMKPEEKTYIRETLKFGVASENLFLHLLECISCAAGSNHQARLHLSGFHSGQLELLLGDSEKPWLSTCIDLLDLGYQPTQVFRYRGCSQEINSRYLDRRIKCWFDGNQTGEDDVVAYSLTNAQPPRTLTDLLHGPSGCDELGRRIVAYRLARSLFRLFPSSWLQNEFRSDCIMIIQGPDDSVLDRWRPHVLCHLGPRPGGRTAGPEDQQSLEALADDVAALGVLLVELEMQRLIPWTDDDRDYQMQRRTNLRRLQRVIDDEWTEWENEHKLRFCDIALACLDFKTHVEEFEHAEDEPSLQYLTILHRSIIEPLYKELSRCSQGLELFPSSYGAIEQPSSVLLYDNGEADGKSEKAEWAQEAMNQWDDNFVEHVRKAKDNPSVTVVSYKRVLVAILDTGIDLEDKAIKRDLRSGRFKGKMNWTDKSQPDDISDNHGHGTHVTRLLLNMAPCADIVVAKVSNELTIPKSKMSGIAQAINWAVDQGANIISMSLGYENYDEAIEAAVSRAYRQGVLMIAAASNQGGNAKKGKGRTRPASSHQVICIHACDGKGNEGGMSPNPKPKTENFSILGVAVPSKWKAKIVHKSGTSFATPVAAALAANVLEFASFHLLPAQVKRLRAKEAMSQVFLDMSEERTDYDHVWPCHWDWSNTSEVIKKIVDALG